MKSYVMKDQVGALAAGAGFGAVVALVNALSQSFADLESATYTTSGWSPAEVVSVLLDSGWAWAGAAVLAGWAVNRGLGQAALAGALVLLAATGGYSLVETMRGGGPESPVWWIAGVVLGAPLGVVGAFARRPGVAGLLARVTVPVGAAVQMLVLPPGRNEVVETIGKMIVWAAAAACVGYFVLVFRRQRTLSG